MAAGRGPGQAQRAHRLGPTARIGSLHLIDGYLHVDERRLKATLYRRGKAIFSARDRRRQVEHGDADGPLLRDGETARDQRPRSTGPYALGTSAYAPTLSEWPGGGVVGIHGTNEPQLIPGRPSHGCIRMRNADIARLWKIVEVGTPIDITD